MLWLKANRRWAALNVVALVVLINVLVRASTQPQNYTLGYDAAMDSGKWALRFLLLSLSMSPLNSYLGWRSAITLRKPAGLWAFAFAALHVFFMAIDSRYGSLAGWLTFPIPVFIIFGLLALIILSALALTSTQRSMKHLGKNWKRLHRLVYAAGTLVVVHALLATASSKKMSFLDPQVIHELKLYAVLLLLLLIVRLTSVRRLLLQATRLPERWSSRSPAS